MGELTMVVEKKSEPTTSSIPELSAEVLKESYAKSINIEIISDKREAFTGALARRFVNMETFDGERDLDGKVVDDYVLHAKKKTFLFELVVLASCVCEYDGVERRVNGQHTCWMRSYLPDSFSEKLVRVIKYKACTEDDFRKLYCLYDNGRSRTRSHKLHARLLGTEAFGQFNPAILNRLSSGLEMYLRGGRRGAKLPKRINIFDEMLGQNSAAIRAVGQFLVDNKARNSPHIWRGAVVGVMIGTWYRSQATFATFWPQVISGDNLSCGDPRKTLRDWLMQTAVSYGAGARSAAVRRVSRDEIYDACVLCWNAVRRGDQLKILKLGAIASTLAIK